MEYEALTAQQIARLVRQRKVSAVEIAKAALARVGRCNQSVRAFITVTEEVALREAAAVDRAVRQGQHFPLAGIPYAAKDLFATKGIRTTSGSRILREHVPDFDATCVARLRAAGAVLIGKSNLHEFAFGFTSINPHYGASANPWDFTRVTGGSSGGSAAAVATSMCPIALGSDTGGSIRLPAALCGIVGLKPTYGLVSRNGATPLAWSLDHVGPIAENVDDAALMLRVIAGYDALDETTTVGRRSVSIARLAPRDLKSIQVGIPRAYFFEGADSEVGNTVEAAIGQLRKLGARLREVSLPHTEVVIGAHRAIIFSEAAAYHRQWIRNRLNEYGADVRTNVLAGMFIPAAKYLTARQARQQIAREWIEVLKSIDVLVMPTALIPAIPMDQVPAMQRGQSRPLARQYVGNTAPFNLLGWPAISIPCGFTRSGLPIGLQLVAKPFQESKLLRVARVYEQSTPWHMRKPSL